MFIHICWFIATGSCSERFAKTAGVLYQLCTKGVGLDRAVREVRLPAKSRRLESQLWQWINFSFWFAVDCER
jgi:hypothetical protein